MAAQQLGGEVSLTAADVEDAGLLVAQFQQLEDDLATVALGRVLLRRLGVVNPMPVPVVALGGLVRGGQGSQSVNAALWADSWNIFTVSSENSSRSLPSVGSLASTSWVTVMMWQPISSACTMLSSSRGLAQRSSTFGWGEIASSASFI